MTGAARARRRFAVIGHPIAHSLSPVMFGAAFDALGLDASYEAIDVAAGALAEWVAARAFDGFNVTVPHKESMLALLDALDDDARAIGAVNTVVRIRDDRLMGSNTDAPGLAAALDRAGVELGGKSSLVIGAGGAARATVVGLARAGVTRIVLAARRPERAREVTEALRTTVRGCGLVGVALDGMEHAKTSVDVLVNATSATLVGGEEAERFATTLPFGLLRPGGYVLDLVYARGAKPTPVVREARARGYDASDGLEMLVHQGARSFERWLPGTTAPLDAMREAVLRAIGR